MPVTRKDDSLQMRCLTMDYVHTGWNIAAFFFPVPVGWMLYKGAFPLFHPESRRTYLKIHDWAVQALCSLLSARVTVCVFCLESLSRNGLTTCFLRVWLISIPLFHGISWKNDPRMVALFPHMKQSARESLSWSKAEKTTVEPQWYDFLCDYNGALRQTFNSMAV